MAAGGEELAKSYETERQNLMKHLLDAVKQCQVRFGGKTELATEKDSCVQCLLVQFENSFLHGLRKGKVWGAINSLSEPLRHVPGIKAFSGIPEVELTFWSFIKEQMPPSEIQRYMSIGAIHTDSGRCRSWLRSSLNETSLERNLVTLLSNKVILRQYYEDWALFLDEERSSTLPIMAQGLGSILFAIETESNQLNAPLKPSFPRANLALAPVEPQTKNDQLSVVSEKGSNVSDHTIVNKKKRRKKVKQATIEEMEVLEDEPLSDMYRKTFPESEGSSSSTGRLHDAASQRKSEKLEAIGKTTSLIADDEGGKNDGIRNSLKTHRRATSLESSEIIRHKQNLYSYDYRSANDFEVPSFGPHGMKSNSTKSVALRDIEQGYIKSDVKTVEGKAENAASPSGSFQDGDVTENPEYTNILSKLASFSTSFKSSFTTGFMQNAFNKIDKEADKPNENQIKTETDDLKNLLEEDDNVFKRTTKLEVREETEESSAVRPKAQKLSSKFKGSPNSTSLPGTIPSDSRNGTFKNRRSSTEYFNDILQKGSQLSPENNIIDKLESAMKLSTPPSTPADSNIVQTKVGNISTVGLEARLNQLERQTEIEAEEEDSGLENMTAYQKEAGACESQDMKDDARKTEDDVADRTSVNSSNTSSLYDDSDSMQPVGFDSERFGGMVITYDQQSSQAANDMMQLLKTSAEVNFPQDELDRKPGINDFTSSRPDRTKAASFDSTMNTSSNSNDLSTAELKQAILATVKRKDEVEERNGVLQLALDEERESCMCLRSEIDSLKDSLHQTQETNGRQIMELSRENEVLRNQLKKYVAAVQLLKRENKSISNETNQAISTLRGYSVDSEVVLPPQPKERTESEMDSIYEEKLIQMSQLHGELMEFHENLQRDLFRKQKIIASTRDELISLRGPLPDGGEESCQDDERDSRQNRPLINIWIPSVFIKGKGSDAHHLYQIYIRIGDEEWNIYRRYSQFHKMHTLSCKDYPEIDKLNFPPKKILGKKDIKFVEGRRKKLQEYIRKLINVFLAGNSLLAQSPSKENLEKSLSFFSDEFSNDGKKTKESSKKKKNKPPVYTGL